MTFPQSDNARKRAKLKDDAIKLANNVKLPKDRGSGLSRLATKSIEPSPSI